MLCPRSQGLFGAGWTWSPGSLALSQILSIILQGLLFISFKLDMMIMDTESLWLFQKNQLGVLLSISHSQA